MMDEVDLIAAERKVELATAARVSQVRGALAGSGSEDCRDCGAPIDVARRQAAPFAVRCVHCQMVAERRKGAV